MNPGDTVLFHPLLIHGSGPNTSQVGIKSCESKKTLSNFPQFRMVMNYGHITVINIKFENTYSTLLQLKFKKKPINSSVLSLLTLIR